MRRTMRSEFRWKLVAQRERSSIAGCKHHDPSWIDEAVLDALLVEFFPFLMSESREIDSLWSIPPSHARSQMTFAQTPIFECFCPLSTIFSDFLKWLHLNTVIHAPMIEMLMMICQFVMTSIILYSAIMLLEASCSWNLWTVWVNRKFWAAIFLLRKAQQHMKMMLHHHYCM